MATFRERLIQNQPDPCPRTIANEKGRKLLVMKKNGFTRKCCACNPGERVDELCSENNHQSTQCIPCENGGNQGMYVHGNQHCIPPSSTSASVSSSSESPRIYTTVLDRSQPISETNQVETRPTPLNPGIDISFWISVVSISAVLTLIVLLCLWKYRQRRKKKQKHIKKKERDGYDDEVVSFVNECTPNEKLVLCVDNFIGNDMLQTTDLQIDRNFVRRMERHFNIVNPTVVNDLDSRHQYDTQKFFHEVYQKLCNAYQSENLIDDLFAFLEKPEGHRLLAEKLDLYLSQNLEDYNRRYPEIVQT